MNIKMNNKAFTLIELMAAVAFSVLLMTGVYGFYNVSSQTYNAGISGQTLQSSANTVISKIIEGESESGTVYRLTTAVSFMIPNGVGTALYSCGGATQISPCNTNDPFGELYYCQVSSCLGAADPNARWYYINSIGTSVCYHHPWIGTFSVACKGDQQIFVAPEGSSLTLRFSAPYLGTPPIPSSKVVEVDVALIKNLSPGVTNQRLATSGTASTFILLRDNP